MITLGQVGVGYTFDHVGNCQAAQVQQSLDVEVVGGLLQQRTLLLIDAHVRGNAERKLQEPKQVTSNALLQVEL